MAEVLSPRDHAYVKVSCSASGGLDARAAKASVLTALISEFGAVGGDVAVDLLVWDSAAKSAILRLGRDALARLQCALAKDSCMVRILAVRGSLASLSRAGRARTAGAAVGTEAVAAEEVARALKKRRR